MRVDVVEHFIPFDPDRPNAGGWVIPYIGKIEMEEKHYYALIGSTHVQFDAQPEHISKRLHEVASLLLEVPGPIEGKHNVYVHPVRYHGGAEGGFFIFTDSFEREHVRTPGDLLHSNGGY